MTKVNISIEDINNNDVSEYIDIAQKIFSYYISLPEIYDNSCLFAQDYESISFDFLFCNGEKTHEINKTYRNKDYVADIITFAIFADTTPEERFIIDKDINLGEVIIALDKTKEEADKKGINEKDELIFLISHGILHLLGFDHQTEQEYNFIIRHQINALKNMGIEYDKI